MSKGAINEFVKLPDINKQIKYIGLLRKDLTPAIQHLQFGVEMIAAIEQSLLAAKLFGVTEKEQSNVLLSTSADLTSNSVYHEVLSSLKIKRTQLHLKVLKTILDRSDVFTISEIHKSVSGKHRVNKASVLSALNLFKKSGLIAEMKTKKSGERKNKDTEIKYRLLNKV